MKTPTVNFGFLGQHSPVLADDAARAERHFREDPRACLAALRVLAEGLAKHAAAYAGLYVVDREELGVVLGRLRDRGVVDSVVAQMFRTLR